jgi:Peptidase family M23
MGYGWPVKPFDQQHAVRGFFCDPRIGPRGGTSFHFGIDVSAPDGTPVYAVEAGTVHVGGAQQIAVTGAHEHAYWHLVPAVAAGQRVAKQALLGHIAHSWGHVHFAERRNGKYWNPLRPGALTPFADFGAPVIERISVEQAGAAQHPAAVAGTVNLIAEAHDNPPISAPAPWQGLPVTPALVRWRLRHLARDVIPWTVVADFRSTLLPKSRFASVYAPGTRQNHANTPGLYRFWLARGWDTRRHPDGVYHLEVRAADIRGNTSRRRLDFVLANKLLHRQIVQAAPPPPSSSISDIPRWRVRPATSQRSE